MRITAWLRLYRFDPVPAARMQAGVAAVILDVACGLGAKVAKERSALSLALMAGAFLANFVFDVNVIFIILAAALAGVGKTLWLRRKGAGAP